MYGRLTRFQIKPEYLNELVARLPQIRGLISQIPRGVANYAFWNEDGSGVAIAVYEDEVAAEAASEQIAAIWGGLAPMLAGPPVMESYSSAESMRT